MKSIALIARRPDMARRDFVEHYETCHAPLASRLLNFARYRRNHLVSGDLLGFSCISEFWADAASVADAMQGAAGETLREDELRFMDKPRNKAALARPLTTHDLSGELEVFLLQGSGSSADLATRFREIGGEVDALSPFDHRVLPGSALGFAPSRSRLELPRGWSLLGQARAVRIEGSGGLTGSKLPAIF